MTWIIEAVEGAFYHRMSNTLKDGKGYKIAKIFEKEDGSLFIDLEMSTNFIDEDGRITVGWNGDDIHIGAFIRLDNAGGILEYCENRFSDDYYRGNRSEKIFIRIIKLEGQVIPRKVVHIRRENILRRLWEGMWETLLPSRECYKNV